MDFQTLITCLIAVTLLTLAPGVDTLLVIRNSARGGWNDGAISSLGICTGLFVHALVSACGISLLLLQTAWAFSGLKIIGALYLVWLGGTSLRKMIAKNPTSFFTDTVTSKSKLNVLRSFREGFLSNVLNPKTVIFYMAFLPQFINPEGNALTQSIIIAAIHFSIAMIYQCILASMVDHAKTWLQKPKVSRTFDCLTGSMMIFLGLRLLFEE